MFEGSCGCFLILDRKIAQGVLGHGHVIRVVYEEINNMMLIITVYPAARRRYRE